MNVVLNHLVLYKQECLTIWISFNSCIVEFSLYWLILKTEYDFRFAAASALEYVLLQQNSGMRFVLFDCLRIHNHCRVRTVADVHRTYGWMEAMRMCRHVTSTWSRLDWSLTGWRCCVCTYAHYRNMYSPDTSMMYVLVCQGTLSCPTSTVWTQCLVWQGTVSSCELVFKNSWGKQGLPICL